MNGEEKKEEAKKDFFKNREEKSSFTIPEPGDYQPEAETNLQACGLDEVSCKNRTELLNDSIFDKIKEMGDEMSLLEIVKLMESHLSKRELAYMMAVNFTNAVIADADKKVKENGK